MLSMSAFGCVQYTGNFIAVIFNAEYISVAV